MPMILCPNSQVRLSFICCPFYKRIIPLLCFYPQIPQISTSPVPSTTGSPSNSIPLISTLTFTCPSPTQLTLSTTSTCPSPENLTPVNLSTPKVHTKSTTSTKLAHRNRQVILKPMLINSFQMLIRLKSKYPNTNWHISDRFETKYHREFKFKFFC